MTTEQKVRREVEWDERAPGPIPDACPKCGGDDLGPLKGGYWNCYGCELAFKGDEPTVQEPGVGDDPADAEEVPL